MRVLWFSPTPSMYNETKAGGWVASLEQVLRQYLPDVSLGIAFDYVGGAKVTKGNVTYYPMSPMTAECSPLDKLRIKLGKIAVDPQYVSRTLSIVDDFKPDVIQCFGSEWPYGLIADYTDVPVVIHMQGFLNIYNLESSLAFNKFDILRSEGFGAKSLYHAMFDDNASRTADMLEQKIMKANSFFMGRTKWDQEIVKYFSPSARYFHCEEALRPVIYESGTTWEWNGEGIPSLITITQAGTLKGNEMILRTAKLLKDQFHLDFVWKVAGDRRSFARFERKTGIKHEDVGIDLLGMISADQIVRELCSARLYVHPAIIDNSPNSLCEAQVIGCPVVASYVGGIPSLVRDGETGFLYPYEEPYALAFKVMDLMGDRNSLKTVSCAEREIALRRHDPVGIARTISHVYSEMLSSTNAKEDY